MRTVTTDSYRVSDRVLIRRGEKFRATGGPYWKSSDGTKVSLTSRGPYQFVSHCKRGSMEWIECFDKDGACCVLHVAGRRRRVDCSLVPRPYKIVGKKRT